MAHAVEQRLPLIDHVLFEFARYLPGDLMVRDGREKWVLREALRPFVTPEVYAGRKHPFLAPPSVLQEGSAMFALVQDTLRSEAAALVPFFEHRALTGFLDQLRTLKGPERAPFDPMLLLLTSVAILHTRYRL
jgi:asparagine synthase (glutamine-hydrolysing)